MGATTERSPMARLVLVSRRSYPPGPDAASGFRAYQRRSTAIAAK